LNEGVVLTLEAKDLDSDGSSTYHFTTETTNDFFELTTDGDFKIKKPLSEVNKTTEDYQMTFEVQVKIA
jgi:hypothetical protein